MSRQSRQIKNWRKADREFEERWSSLLNEVKPAESKDDDDSDDEASPQS